jgi:hypothetical protein
MHDCSFVRAIIPRRFAVRVGRLPTSIFADDYGAAMVGTPDRSICGR